MAYLTNNTRAASLTINGVDYTSNLKSWSVSDASANKQGCIQTTGTINLGTAPSGALIEDYDRDNFRRGATVILDVTKPDGSVARHPRGYLFVISTSYSVEAEELIVEIGCRLSLIALTEDSSNSQLDTLIALVPFTLNPTQRTYSNCCAGFASTGQYIYQDNNDSLIVSSFWDGDGLGTVAAGEWVSILGTTTSSVAPLAGAGAIPDSIKLSYQVPSGSNNVSESKTEITETESYYFLQYPAASSRRVNSDADIDAINGTLNNIQNSVTYLVNAVYNDCGNAPPPPQQSEQDDSCNDGYEIIQSPVTVPAIRREVTTTTYNGPGGQQDYTETEIFGPRVEANNQYFADKFAYCKSVFASACRPDGFCPRDGLGVVKLAYSTSKNEFGRAGELVKTTTDNYQLRLTAAQPTDWRAGNNGGRVQQFNSSYATDNSYFRVQRTETLYYQNGNTNFQDTKTYNSITSRGVGISSGANIDALRGVVTRQVRKSTTISTLDVQPDTINEPTRSTVERTRTLPLFTGRFKTPPDSSGPYELDEQIPLPLLYYAGSVISFTSINAAVEAYSDYIIRFTKGDIFGLQIGESLRNEVLDNWYPGMPFRYYDPSKGKIMAMRMDATVWGVTTDEAAFVTNGMWNGFTNGTVTTPDNLVGNSTPDLTIDTNGELGGTGGSPTPPGAVVDPGIVNEDTVDNGAIAFNVDVEMTFQAIANTFTIDGIQSPPPDPETLNTYRTFVTFCEGIIVGPGDLLEANGDGSIPLEYNGQLVVSTATVVDPDVFA